MSRPSALTLTIFGVLSLSFGFEVRADFVRLRNGGEVHGVVEQGDKSQPIAIRTLSGANLVFQPDEVQFVVHRPVVEEEYDARAAKARDTVQDQWALAEWCRRNKLLDLREDHLVRVIELDQNHARARAALGHVSYQGRWLTRDQWMEARGFAKYNDRYVSAARVATLSSDKTDLEARRNWTHEIRALQKDINSNDANKQQIAAEKLHDVTDPQAVRPLRQSFAQHPNSNVRKLYVETLAAIPGPESAEALVWQSINDPDAAVRNSVIGEMQGERMNDAYPFYAKTLKSPNLRTMRQAATTLGRIGDRRAIPELIDVLLTMHREGRYVLEPDLPKGLASIILNYTGDRQWAVLGMPENRVSELQYYSLDLGTIQRTGMLGDDAVVALKPIWAGPMRRVYLEDKCRPARGMKNPEVRDALQDLTGVDYGYDRVAWSRWWKANEQQVWDAMQAQAGSQ